eukprot:1480978-Pyramimonas_sp.AAC.1
MVREWDKSVPVFVVSLAPPSPLSFHYGSCVAMGMSPGAVQRPIVLGVAIHWCTSSGLVLNGSQIARQTGHDRQ